jgi:ABC-type Mn2+/Zn2+ transport system permease subunit
MSRRLYPVLLIAVLVGLAGTLGGLWLSIGAGMLSPGASIVGVLSVLFIAGYAASRLRPAR